MPSALSGAPSWKQGCQSSTPCSAPLTRNHMRCVSAQVDGSCATQPWACMSAQYIPQCHGFLFWQHTTPQVLASHLVGTWLQDDWQLSKAELWFASKKLPADAKLSKHVGRNEKTKVPDPAHITYTVHAPSG